MPRWATELRDLPDERRREVFARWMVNASPRSRLFWRIVARAIVVLVTAGLPLFILRSHLSPEGLAIALVAVSCAAGLFLAWWLRPLLEAEWKAFLAKELKEWERPRPSPSR